MKKNIEFEEISSSATDFLHELNDPAILRNQPVPPEVSVELRRQQLRKIQENIQVLKVKREEFDRKIDEYIENLKALMRSLEQRIVKEAREQAAHAPHDGRHVTMVRCLGCDSQRTFKELRVVFARESDESLAQPTDLYVLNGGTLKKGRFRCGACGTGNLTIRSV